jgi:hypothetical protein
MVRVARLATNVDVAPEICMPRDTNCRLADRLVGSPIEMAYPRPMAITVITAASPET